MYFLYIYRNKIKQNQTVYCLILNKQAEHTGNQKKKHSEKKRYRNEEEMRNELRRQKQNPHYCIKCTQKPQRHTFTQLNVINGIYL